MKKPFVWMVIFGVILSIAAFDAYLYLDGVPQNSITQLVIETTKKSTLFTAMLGFVFGFLFAHFFDTDSQGSGRDDAK